ncbi:MAG: bifunctional lysylphosphatidylglycerol flippase/synthetase MprF [Gemmatimonadaceae bacterium]|nr:bifunctional lysylphosphatidylglycerol flippase/synthetase MprF [Gemmatimonadaceae bacterium]
MTMPRPSTPAVSGSPVVPGTSLEGSSVSAVPRWISRVAMAVVVVAVLATSADLLRHTSYHAITREVMSVSRTRVMLALLLTIVAYQLLVGYDYLALRQVGGRLSLGRTWFASTVAYALSQTLGFPLLTGGAVRLRLWSQWGLSGVTIATATVFVSITFGLGAVLLAALALISEPASLVRALHLPVAVARATGVVLLLAVFGYVWAAYKRPAWRWPMARFSMELPSARMAIAQIALALADWTAASAVVWVLLPSDHAVPFLGFLGLFVLAQLLGVISHVPGGVGVFESIMLMGLHGRVDTASLTASLLMYRVVYYWLPFALGVLALAVYSAVASWRSSWAQWWRVLQPLLPPALGISTFLGGALLVFSGATPGVHGRLRVLGSVLPLGLVEFSHFVGSMAGVALMVLGAALRRRLDAAWGVAIGVLAIGIAVSLTKGLDWEEACMLSVVLVALLLSRGAFYRRATLSWDLLTPGWIAAVAGVVLTSVWLGLFVFRHVDYTNTLWWEFAFMGNAPRFLRASAGAMALLIFVATFWLLRPSARPGAAPTESEVSEAAAIAVTAPTSVGALALLSDKALIFSRDRDAFVMYGAAGRSWISMGDPVGSARGQADAAWRFYNEADRAGAWPVFYQVTASHLPLYIELGLTMLKLGEEAVVPLKAHLGDAPPRKWMRRALKDADHAGLRFHLAMPNEIPALLPELQRVSDSWLRTKHVREKGFSLGYFDGTYLQHFPHALVYAPRVDGERLVAFCNLWHGAPGSEISPDLMRHAADAPRGTMDFLFVRLMQWAAREGYQRFNLGMAPMSGLRATEVERAEASPLWSRVGTLLYERGEPLYNFQGLRAFKEKFEPEWEPRFLAAPGGLVLPRALSNVAQLIAGGMTGLVMR